MKRVERPTTPLHLPRGIPIPAWAHAAGGAGLAVVVAAGVLVVALLLAPILGVLGV